VLHHLSTKILCQSAYLKRRPDGRTSGISLCNGPNNCISHLEIVRIENNVRMVVQNLSDIFWKSAFLKLCLYVCATPK
jgi:hypothetical protein